MRLLTKDEATVLHEKLKNRWGVTDYWYPLNDYLPDNTDAIVVCVFSIDPYLPQLREALLKNNIHSLFELREHGDWEYEIKTETFDPYYDGAEGYWFDQEMNWLVYASHECSLTFAGSLMVKIIKDIFPDYQQHLWSFGE